MPLKLTLKPTEKVVINGAVITNGGSKATITVENSAVIMRQKDIMLPEDADTPARRIYYAIQLAYLDEAGREDTLETTRQLILDFLKAVPTQETRAILEPMGAELANGQFFAALKRCKSLIEFEEARLSYVG